MATTVRRQLSALIRDLEAEAPSFDFFQAVRLLEEHAPRSRPGSEGPQGAMRLRAATEISFPGADLRRAYRGADGAMVLECNFMGLYGVAAPLPAYFWESVARQEDAGRCLRAFLDLFGGRLYELLYLAWKKGRAHLHTDESASRLEQYLLALSGAIAPPRRDLALAFAGGFGSRAKGGAALNGMLREHLGVGVRIEEFVPCWVEVGPVSVLGQTGMTLGDDLVLGERVLDVGRKINVIIGPLSEARAREFFPGGNSAREFQDLVNGYLEPTLEYDVIFLVEGAAAERCLGQEPIYLGWTSALGEAGVGPRRIRLPGSAYKG
ncbi:type VI secretion system baseplate subunit TssG [Geoalkalibacter halelectricus]|uniref:type VI secretion system baseplate subunit TssG n=1 Tax=Geoalkalibacter halelectricus TaxID=2847045 RepID=UPI003D25473A